METPKNSKQGPQRQPTPRLSERKRNLFEAKVTRNDSDNDAEEMDGISPLEEEASIRYTRRSQRYSYNGKGELQTPTKVAESYAKRDVGDDFNKMNEKNSLTESPRRRSPRLKQQNNNQNASNTSSVIGTPKSSKYKNPHNMSTYKNSSKENVPTPVISSSSNERTEDQLQKLFRRSLRLNSHVPRNEPVVVPNNEIACENMQIDEPSNVPVKRPNCSTCDSAINEPQSKIPRLQTSPDQVFIPAKSFYSNHHSQTSTKHPVLQRHFNVPQVSSAKGSSSMKSKRHTLKQHINRGVRHKVRKPTRHIASTANDVDAILNSIGNEKLRKLIIRKREERQQIEKVHNILRSSRNPIEQARPLSALSHDDSNNNNNNNNNNNDDKHSKTIADTSLGFSDIESSSDDYDDEALSEQKCDESADDDDVDVEKKQEKPSSQIESEKKVDAVSSTPTVITKRKFFKSGRETNTPKEIQITDHIRATMCNGRISLLKDKTKEKKYKKSTAVKFTVEQAAVDAILKNLDDTAFGDVTQVETSVASDSITTSAAATATAMTVVTTTANNQPQEPEMSRITLQTIEEQSQTEVDTVTEPETECDEETDIMSDIQLMEQVDYDIFRNRLPYNTNDKEEIERQHLLLNFLISNDICNEETFNIFIADPDNHKEEAARIVDQVIMVVNEHDEFRQRLPYNTTDPDVIAQQNQFLEYLIQHNMCNEENFDIFIANYETRRAEAEAIITEIERCLTPAESDNTENMYLRVDTESPSEDQLAFNIPFDESDQPVHNCNVIAPIAYEPVQVEMDKDQEESHVTDTTSENKSPNEMQEKLFPIFSRNNAQPLKQASTRHFKQRTWAGGYGLDQYQIDAGQKAFGAKQCKQCGLVYSACEAEEERLHRDYHSSMHILRFKAWIDEDLVAVVPEWGLDGRIIRITESAHSKRRERLMDVLKIVDKELGFSSYIIPNVFVAFLAVRKCQIVGLCLVQPLKTANKYLNINGIDCCTNEEFEAKCGISRIWVSPLHRRIGVASKLFRMVRLNTIHGEEIPVDKIAFSSPTQDGRVFAQKITGLESFLVYQ